MKTLMIRALVCGAIAVFCACSSSHDRDPEGAIAWRSASAEPRPEIGPEIGTDKPVPIQENVGSRPDVAGDGANYVAVFEDSSDVRAVRVDSTGTVLDMPWIRFGEPDMSQTEPAVAFGGGRYLVVWTQSDGIESLTVQGRLMRPDGTLEGTKSFQISSAEVAGSASVAWNGTNFVVAWNAYDDNQVYDVHVTLVGTEGNVVSGSDHVVSTGGKALRPSVAAGTGVSVIAWEDQQTEVGLIRAARIDSDGTVLDAGGVRLSDATTTEDEVELASSGTSFLVAWRKAGSPSSIRASILSDDGTVTAKDVAVSHSSVETGSPSVAFNGTSYLVAWGDDRDDRSVYGAVVSTAGAVASSTDSKLAEGHPWQILNNNTSLVGAGSGFFLAFQGNGIEGSFISLDRGIFFDKLELSPLPNKQGSPNLAWNGQDYVVSWIDEREPSFENYSGRAVRINPEGEVLDPEGLVLSGDEKAFSLDTASNGKGADVVVWANTAGEAWQRSLASDGALSSPVSVASSGQSTSPAIATNGDGYLVVFSDSQTSTTASVSGRLLDAAGAASTPFVIEPAAEIDFADALSAGQDYLVRYRKAGIWLVPVSHTGVVGTKMQLSTSLVQVSSATNGTHTLVVWTDITDMQVRGRIYASGAWQGEPFVVSATSAGYGAAVAWDGTTYWVVWENDPDAHPLYARTVSGSGVQGAVTPLVEDDCNAPALASDGDGQLLLSYYKYTESSRVRRIVSRFFGRIPEGGGDGGAGGSGGAGEATEGGAAGNPAGNAGAGGAPTIAGAGGKPIGGAAGAPSTGGRSSAGSTSNGGGPGTAGSAGSAGTGDVPPSGCSISHASTASRSDSGLGWSLGVLAGLALVRLRRRAAGKQAGGYGSRPFLNS